MKAKTDITTRLRRIVHKSLGAVLLLAATALLLQGCTTARAAWTDKADADPFARRALEQAES